MKKIQVKHVFESLKRLAPLELAESWDNVGLQVGDLENEVEAILVSLDPTEAVFWESVEKGANLIVTHHPLLFNPLKALDNANVPARLARLSVQIDLNILSFHTNLDSTLGGLNDVLAKKLNIKKLKPLLPHKKNPKVGLGRIGKVPLQSLESLIKKIKKDLKLKNLRFSGDLKQKIQDVAVLTGSGGGYFSQAKAAGAQVLVTGDVKYHHALDASHEGLALIDIGHFAGEFPMIQLIANYLKKWSQQKKVKLKISESQAQKDPIEFYG